MKLYVCYGTWRPAPWRRGGHPCGNAHHALTEAGYDPQVIKTYGLAALGPLGNQTPGRRTVKKLTGSYWVPVLVTDEGTVVQGSHEIADWARANPAGVSPAPATAGR